MQTRNQHLHLGPLAAEIDVQLAVLQLGSGITIALGDLVFALGTPDIAGRIGSNHPSCDGPTTS